jgi:ubiquinone/menaquinone biosynthesis C-methylase UbiE
MESLNEHNKANEYIWDEKAKIFDKRGGWFFRYFQKRIISIINLQKNSNFLDLGCGTGWAVRYASTLLKGEGHFIGIDISKGMIEKANRNALGLKNINFYKTSAEELPLENNFFDNIICTFSFHHYFNPENALTEAYRVLKQKGKIYIFDITADDFFTKWRDNRMRKKQKEHIKFYSTIEFKTMFSAVRLKYIKSKIIIAEPFKVHIAEK